MLTASSKGRPLSTWKTGLALCCALLLIFGVTLQVAHVHSLADSSHASCTLCATAHVVVSPAAPVQAPTVAHARTTPVAELEPGLTRRLPYFSLYMRPPPAEPAFS